MTMCELMDTQLSLANGRNGANALIPISLLRVARELANQGRHSRVGVETTCVGKDKLLRT